MCGLCVLCEVVLCLCVLCLLMLYSVCRMFVLFWSCDGDVGFWSEGEYCVLLSVVV